MPICPIGTLLLISSYRCYFHKRPPPNNQESIILDVMGCHKAREQNMIVNFETNRFKNIINTMKRTVGSIQSTYRVNILTNLPNQMREQKLRTRTPPRSFNKSYSLIISGIINFHTRIVSPRNETRSPLHSMYWTFTRVQNLIATNKFTAAFK